jgi:nucleoside-diphosphate-sugar epimerase
MLINSFKDNSCLVVGGNGFIGRSLVSKLLALGGKLTSLDLCIPKDEEKKKGVEYIDLDVSDKFSNRLKYDFVFNLSGFINHSKFQTGGRSVIDAHYLGLLNLVEALDTKSIKGFVQIGSSDEYGSQPSPQVESMRESPISPYSAAKVAGSHFIQMLARQEKFPGTVLRFFLVYGPGQNNERFLPQVIKGCLEDKSFPTSQGEQLRDFCYIDDVVDAILLAATNPRSHGEIFNIASGKAVSIAGVIKKIKETVGSGEPQFGKIPYREGENMSLYANCSKAKNILGWEAKTSLEEGLSQTVNYYKKECRLL